jgi:hypothetical protein
METIKSNSHSKIKAFMILIGLSAAFIFMLSIILHIDPLNMADSVIDFANHHYFLMGFISLIVMLICFKIYSSIDKVIDNNYVQKTMPGYTRAKRKRKMLLSLLENTYYQTQKLRSHSVEKDSIKGLKFIDKDVLDQESALERKANLEKAVMLGNAIKHKVRIFFKDQQSNKHVETTIWHADERYISLKGGITIPVRSIYKVEI